MALLAADDATRLKAPALAMRDVSFSYPSQPGEPVRDAVLSGASLSVVAGEFCLLTGATGSGKTTLLRLAKREVAPAGGLSGDIEVFGRPVASFDVGASASTVGFVSQDPDAQIVCDTVWHELAFGLENLGVEPSEMRRRVAEVSYFLGIERWLRRPTSELSGGQKQLLALASVLVMEPRLLLLDEPTSMLDPIARDGFAHALFRLNRELAITVVVATHEPWSLLPYATSALELDGGVVRRTSLDSLATEPALLGDAAGPPAPPAASVALRISDVWLRYGRDDPWVLRGCSFSASFGEVSAIVGGNGCGKSTLLRLAAGTLRGSRGKVENLARDHQALLPQDPEALLGAESVADELMEWSERAGYGRAEADAMADRLGIGGLLGRDPLDLSCGQRQLVAIAKLLLMRPRLLLADEPTLGLDSRSRSTVARIFRELVDGGIAVVMATHDLAFAREVSDVTSMLFDGDMACTLPSGEFFERNVFFR